ncbi:MlaD family protein [Salinisphaera sp.]|uniref:MlaD family protein n=1 Tax=Salinisphaera sp. TaxID=1914330 RepID=UPI002D772A4C|nr:MlaD family protein [Salinisphaera sp.]HET7313767.1 MlaD family protein [Salinisphaera sp.]
MASNRSYTIIGAFLLGAIALTAVGILTFGNTGLFSDERRAIIFFNQSVLGLNNGSRVLFRGVQVGTVRRVQLRLNPQGGAKIAVTIEVSGNDVVVAGDEHTPSDLTIEEMVKRGLRAQLVVYSYVTSQLAVNLGFDPENQPNFVVPPDELDLPEIPAVPSEISQLKDTVAQLPWKEALHQIQQAMSTMVQLAQDLDNTVNRLGPNLDQTAQVTRQTLKTVQQAVAANNKQLQATLASVRTLSDTANDEIASHDKQIDKLLDNAQQTSENLSELSQNLEQFTDPESGTRQDIQSAVRDLAAAASSLRRFAEKIERDPHTLLYGGSR